MSDPKTIGLSAELHAYTVAHGTPPDDVQESLIAATQALGGVSRMQIAPEQGAFMTILTRLVDARFAVEVGTFTGYSSLCIARGLAPGGQACCAATSARSGRRSPASTGPRPGSTTASSCASARPPTRCEPCPPTRRSTSRSSTPTRPATARTTTRSCTRLRPGGIVLIDNVLWSGRVIDPSDTERRHRGHPVHQRPRGGRRPGRGVLLPIADGLTLVRKR